MKFLPQRAQIDSFGGGGFRFAAMSHLGSVQITPSGMRAFAPTSVDNIKAEDFSQIIAEHAEIDVLVIGTGATMKRLAPPILELMKQHNMAFDVMSTSAAVHSYNLMLGEDRRVAAILLAVDRAHDRTT